MKIQVGDFVTLPELQVTEVGDDAVKVTYSGASVAWVLYLIESFVGFSLKEWVRNVRKTP